MKKTIRFLAHLIPAAVLVVGLLASCAGGPADLVSGPDSVLVSLSSEAEIKAAYGYAYAANPFLPPPGVLGSKRNTFLVVRFTAAANVSLEIAGADLSDATGMLKARALGRDELKRFWEARATDSGGQTAEALNDRRRAAIDRYALNLYEPNALRKNSPYSLLILGPRKDEMGTAQFTVRYYVNGQYMERIFPVEFEVEK